MTPDARARAIADQLTCFVPDEDVSFIATAIREAVAAEREACAKMADDYANKCQSLRREPGAPSEYVNGLSDGADSIAAAIRSRSKEGGEE